MNGAATARRSDSVSSPVVDLDPMMGPKELP